MDILQGLNSKQQEAVTAIDGNIRVTAGAGSGKTRVLAHRYAFLVNEVGISPANILCMTFTNKAAQEMKNRIRTMVHQGNVNDFVCTIHGFCVKFLREEIFRLGYPKNFAIIDEEDSKDLAKQVMEELGLNKTVITAKQFLQRIHIGKANGEYVGKYMLPNVKFEKINPHIRYLQLQLKLFALDFEDLIHFTIYILSNFEKVRKKWQERLNYIMVDEAQDCSNYDWAIIRNLMGDHHNLFFVGDPDQCIYEWRGAKPAFFIGFKPDKEVILDENYRSTPNILDVANSIISHNKVRIKKDLFTEKAKDKIVLHYHAASDDKEGEWIATQIENVVKAGQKYSDVAVLYRASYQSRFVEQALLKKHIQYTVWGGIRFFERKEIKDALAYLRLLVYHDDISFRRIINVPSRGFGRQSLINLTKSATVNNLSLFAELSKDVIMFRKKEWLDFIHLFRDAKEYEENHSISDTLEFLLEGSGYKDMLRFDDDQERIDNLRELINSIKYYEDVNKNEEDLSIENYLQDIALYTNADYKKDSDTVKLMTIHQSKGLEFPYIFVCGLTEGIFPSHRSIRERREAALEEERRLMYVAVTRAEKALFLTESEGYNYTTRGDKFPSRFLKEIGDGLIQVEGNLDPALFEGTQYAVDELEDELNGEDEDMTFNVGDLVVNKYLGKGKVLEVDKDERAYKVQFKHSVRTILEGKLESADKKADNNENKEENSKEVASESKKSNVPNYKKGQRVFNPQFGFGIIDDVLEETGRMSIDYNNFTQVTAIDDPYIKIVPSKEGQ